MIQLLRRFLRPYGRALIVIVLLLFLQAVGNLYLPTLNADIINNGVVTGNIRNIIVNAAYLAANNGNVVTMAHLLHGARREMQKMGRLVGEME